MFEQEVFYRGDSISNNVLEVANEHPRREKFIKQYVTEGLLANSANGGVYFADDIPYWVAAHVGHEKDSSEEAMYKKSPFISFSASERKAFNFMNAGTRCNYTECGFFDATHFIWTLSRVHATAYDYDSTSGIYCFEYHASTCNVERFTSSLTGGSDADRIRASIIHPVHKHIAHDNAIHCALLIDAATYLSNNRGIQKRKPELVRRAIKKASDDKEWLLCPMDPMPDGHGVSARFHLNVHLDILRLCRAL